MIVGGFKKNAERGGGGGNLASVLAHNTELKAHSEFVNEDCKN